MFIVSIEFSLVDVLFSQFIRASFSLVQVRVVCVVQLSGVQFSLV